MKYEMSTRLKRSLLKPLAVGAMLSLVSVAALAEDFTPSNTGWTGLVPGNYDVINYTVNDDSRPDVRLPAQGKSSAVLRVINASQSGVRMLLANSSLPMDSVIIQPNEEMRFRFDAGNNTWVYYPLGITEDPSNTGQTVKINTQDKVTVYRTTNASATPTVYLPNTAPDNHYVVVSNQTTNVGGIIDSGNWEFPRSRNNFQSGAMYAFRFSGVLKKWQTVAAPTKTVYVPDSRAPYQVPTNPTKYARTVVQVVDGGWAPKIQLPISPYDRDRVTVTSTAAWESEIDTSSTDYQGTMKLNKGQSYEFMFDGNAYKWVLLASPEDKLVDIGAIPTPRVPLTRLTLGSVYYFGSRIDLPRSAKTGDQIIVNNTTAFSQGVYNGNGQFLDTVGTERARYIYGSNGWSRSTGIVTFLSVFSDAAAKAWVFSHLPTSIDLVNDALENSGVGFYIKEVGRFQYTIPNVSNLSDVINRASSDATIDAKRKQVGANGVYYEGFERGNGFNSSACGVSFVDAPSRDFMFAASSITCSAESFRVQVAQLMGVSGCENNNNFKHGWSGAGGDVNCSGNVRTYYSSPNKYDRDTGSLRGNPSTADAVRTMNERFPAVSKF